MNTKNIFSLILCFVLLSACNTTLLLTEQKTKLSDYETVSYSLPEQLVEISGLQIYEGDFIGFNDSGGEPELYRISPQNSKDIKQTIRLKKASNVDWEAIAKSDSLVFVGDFGNNLGNRKDLNIYFMRKSNFKSGESQEVESKKFSFFYPEQKVFDNQAYNHDFDMESMVYYDNKLHLFTKEWKSEKTHHYTLDLVKGTQPAWLVEDFDVNFLVTDADIISLDSKYTRLGLVGYTRDGDVYMLLTDFKDKHEKWLGNPKTLIHLGFAGVVGQVEGISFVSQDEVCFSAEKITMDDMTKEQNITCFSLK